MPSSEVGLSLMRRTCLRMVYELAKQDDRIVFIGSDLGAGVLEDFKREMPDRFFMEGIGEANMVGMAAGMALSGKIVYCHTIATFLTRRAFEQVAIDVGLHQANVRLIGAGGGAVYAPLGPTHLATDDIALMRTIPGMTILAPCDAVEMEALMPQTVDHKGPIYIRLGRGGDPVITPEGDSFHIGWTRRVKSGDDVLLVATGTATQIAKQAAELLLGHGISAEVRHVPTLKPFAGFDPHQRVVVTIEDHSTIGGLGDLMADAILSMGNRRVDVNHRQPKFIRIGYPDVFPHGYGTQDEMRARYGLTAEAIVAQVRSTWVHS
jgi:transketolase